MKKITVFILISYFCTLTVFSQDQTIPKKQDNSSTEKYSDYQKYVINENSPEFYGSDKNPATAFLMSLFIPGLGQMYNEDVGFGFGLFTGFLVGGAVGFTQNDATLRGAGLLIAGLSWLISVIQAPNRSYLINEKNRIKRAILWKKYHSMMQFNTDIGTINLNIQPIHNGAAGIVSVSF